MNKNFQILNQEVLCQAILEPEAQGGHDVSDRESYLSTAAAWKGSHQPKCPA